MGDSENILGSKAVVISQTLESSSPVFCGGRGHRRDAVGVGESMMFIIGTCAYLLLVFSDLHIIKSTHIF